MPDESRGRRYRRFWGADPRRDVDDEVAFHVQMRIDEFTAAGLSPDRAEAEALKRFGDMRQVRDEMTQLGARRAARTRLTRRWSAVRHDLRSAVRALAAHRAFTAVVALTMALGIGATTAVFSVAYGVLLRPLPYAHSEALVRLWSKNAGRGIEFFSVSPADAREWSAQNDVFAHMGAFERQQDATLLLGDTPQSIDVARVTPSVFDLLGTRARFGRALREDDARADAPPVAVLSEEAWINRFGGDSAILERDISLDGRRYSVIGIMPSRFSIPGTPALIWTPLSLAGASDDHGNRYLRVLARLKPGVTADRARASMDVIASRIAADAPGTNDGWTVNMMSVEEMVIGTQFRRSVFVLLGVVVFVLLIACANAANLQLTRGAGRRKEMAVRASLGASRGRIVAQLLAESLVVSVIAGGVGLLLAYGGVSLLRLIGASSIPRLDDVQLDAPVLAFTAFIALGSGLLFGLVPALRTSRPDLVEALKEDGRTMTGSRAAERMRAAFVVSEVMLSVMLVIGAVLLMRSFVRLTSVDLGFDARGVTVVTLRLPDAAYATPERRALFFGTLLERAAQAPGVSAVAGVSSAPFGGPNSGLVFVRTDQAIPPRAQAPDADFRVITPGYIKTLGISLRHGREFTAEDRATTAPVALISEVMARRYWPNDDPVGTSVRVGDLAAGPVYTIVGVVGDARYLNLESPEVRPMMYLSADQSPQRAMSIVVRGPAATTIPEIRHIVASLDPTLPLASITQMDDLVSAAMATRRFALALFGIFAALAMVLAVVGVYSVMSYLVRQRTREMGIRIALGASAGAIVSSVVARGFRLTAAGVVLGVVGALLLTRLMSSLLFDVNPRDPVTFVVVAVGLTGVACLASLIPARRAARADPLSVLRQG
jgi:predicted permease